MLYATVRNRKIHVKRPDTVVQNGVNVDWLELDMDDEWKQMDSIVCVFVLHYTEENTTTAELSTTTTITEKEVQKEMLHTFGEPVMVPWECLEHTGMLSVNCTGYVDKDGERQQIMTTAYPDSYWEVVQNGPVTGEDTLEPTPTLYDQIVAAAGDASAAAAAANTAREQLLQDRANGAFDGKDGESMRVTVGKTVTGASGTSANVYQTGDDNNCVLNFTIPRGDPGPVPSALPNPYPLSLDIEGVQIEYDGSQAVVAQINSHVDADWTPAINRLVRQHNEDETAHPDIREAIPEQLPNPHALSLNINGVNVEYDGSAAVSVEIPTGDGGGTDLSLGVTGATVGQSLKITSVDEEGRPTAWEAVDMPGSGGSGTVTHSVTWNLTNVTSSNDVVSVSDGGSLVAVLSPADGYALGDVTITMAGEVATNYWNADTATVDIPSVTGDVMISCVGVELTGPVDTTAVIAQEDCGINTAGENTTKAGYGITKVYEFTYDINALKQSPKYDSENDYLTGPAMGGFIVSITNTNFVANGGVTTGSAAFGRHRFTADGEYIGIASNPTSGGKISIPIKSSAMLNANVVGVEFNIPLADINDAYAYWCTPNPAACASIFPNGYREGDIVFAGKNTEYYGMANIDGTLVGGEAATALSVDDDIAQDYSIATTSILGEETATDTSTAYGISASFAAVIDEVRTAWMTEYGGDYRKIPIIVSTDQHGRRNSGIFNMLGKTLSMYDVSRIMNLGDTVATNWSDADTDHPLLTDSTLEAWCESVEAIPFSKQLNVFGNHDTWYGNYTDEGNTIGTRYPSSQAHLYQYFRNIYARRLNNNGWFSVCDDAFNVKYVVVSMYEYKGGTGTTEVRTEQMAWLIEELSENDGYDVVIVAHEPCYITPDGYTSPTGDTNPATINRSRFARVLSARKSLSAGTVTDTDGVDHSYDFSGCKNPVLCSLHGHTHKDLYQYLDGGLLQNTFDWFDDNTFFFALIDRVNNQLNIWKVEGDALTYKNYQIPLDKQEES